MATPFPNQPKFPFITPIRHFHAIQVHGARVADFLQGQLTCDMTHIHEGQGSLGACCDIKGRVLANFFVMKIQEDYYLILPQDMLTRTMNYLQKYANFSRVTLSPTTSWTIWECYQCDPPSHPDCYVSSFRTRLSQWVIACSADAEEKMQTYAEQHSCLSSEAWQTFNITSGLVWISPNTSGLLLPQMIDLEKWGGISFDKGCYLGQEIIARTQHRGKVKRHLYQACIESPRAPEKGDEIQYTDNETIGLIVMAEENNGVYPVLAVLQDRAFENSSLTPLPFQVKGHLSGAIAEIKSHHGWKRCPSATSPSDQPQFPHQP